MEKKAKTYNVRRLVLLAFTAGVAVGVVYVATQWRPVSHASAAPATTRDCVFVNHVRVGAGHPYRQEPGENCTYEAEPVW